MKKCPVCGDGFVGFGEVCQICRRDINRRPARPPEEAPAEVQTGKLSPGDLCPHCGMEYRPRVSNADRQRRYRARKSK